MSNAPNVAPQADVDLEISIAPVEGADRAYCLGSWREALKTVPGNDRVPWGIFRRAVTPQLRSILDGCEVIGAHADGAIVGWIALTRGKRVHACHWVHTRYETAEGAPLRRRGIMTALIAAAELGPRFVYTFRGGRPRNRHAGDARGTTDEFIRRWLAAQGVTAIHIPYQEWSK